VKLKYNGNYAAGQKVHIQEVMGSNPAVNWIDVSNLLAITLKKNWK
jgi:hypothetical protein